MAGDKGDPSTLAGKFPSEIEGSGSGGGGTGAITRTITGGIRSFSSGTEETIDITVLSQGAQYKVYGANMTGVTGPNGATDNPQCDISIFDGQDTELFEHDGSFEEVEFGDSPIATFTASQLTSYITKYVSTTTDPQVVTGYTVVELVK